MRQRWINLTLLTVILGLTASVSLAQDNPVIPGGDLPPTFDPTPVVEAEGGNVTLPSEFDLSDNLNLEPDIVEFEDLRGSRWRDLG